MASSRKRAPLVHRPSNPELPVDWRTVSKQLAGSTDEREIDRLIPTVVDSLVGEVTVVESVVKLMANKVSRVKLSESSQRSLANLLGKLKSVHQCPHAFGLIRALVKASGGNLISWPGDVADGERLLFLEMVAWDSVSDGQVQKVEVSKRLSKMTIVHADHVFGVGLVVPLAPADSEGIRSCSLSIAAALSNADPTPLLARAITAGRASIQSPTRSSSHEWISVCSLVNCGVWMARLLGNDELAKECLDLVVELRRVPHHASQYMDNQVKSLQVQLGVRTPDDDANDSRLLRMLTAVSMREPLTPNLVVSDRSENRYEVALLSYFSAVNAVASVDQVAFGLYALHCLKWIDAPTQTSIPTGMEGLLSLLFADLPSRVVPSLVPSVPPLQRLFILVDSVRVAGRGFLGIGYIPGASWLYQKGLAFIASCGTNRALVARYERMFKSELKRIHIESLTAIADDVLDYSAFDTASPVDLELVVGAELLRLASSESRIPLTGVRLALLREVVKRQHILQSSGDLSHSQRLDQVLRLPRLDLTELVETQRMGIVGPVVTMDIDDDGQLSVSVIDDNRSLFSCTTCAEASGEILALVSQLHRLMDENKAGIAVRLGDDRSDSNAFWTERKAIDQALGELLVRMESTLLSPAAVASVRALATDSVTLLLPDLLSALPVESMPCLRSKCCVRGLLGLSPTEHSRDNDATLRFSYVMNPNGDCGSTELSIQPSLVALGWTGHSGSPTLTDSEFTAQLSRSDVFLFSGHGGGEKHWSGSSVQRLFVREKRRPAPAALLMGCSSARPYGDHAHPFCTPYHYIVGGFAIVVGTLWDVLGRELDRITAGIIDQVAKEVRTHTDLIRRLPSIVASARRRARLANLSSASIVVHVDLSALN